MNLRHESVKIVKKNHEFDREGSTKEVRWAHKDPVFDELIWQSPDIPALAGSGIRQKKKTEIQWNLHNWHPGCTDQFVPIMETCQVWKLGAKCTKKQTNANKTRVSTVFCVVCHTARTSDTEIFYECFLNQHKRTYILNSNIKKLIKARLFSF